MFTLIFTILIVYFLWLVVKPLAAAYIRRSYERKVNDFIRNSFGSSFGIDPDEMRRREAEAREQRYTQRQRRGKIFSREDGEYIDFVEIDGKTEYTTTTSSTYTPREPQVSDAEWEEVK